MEKLSNIWGSHEEHHEQKEEDDLTTLLTRDERAELVRLVAMSTETMRQAIEANFRSTQADQSTGDPLVSRAQKSLGVSAEGQEQERDASELRDLEAALLGFFDEWRDAVTLRLGEVVNSRDSVGKSSSDQQSKSDLGAAHSQGDTPVQKAVERRYAPVPTTLADITEDKRVLIVHSVLLLLLSLEHYTAYSRVLLLYLVSSLKLKLEVLEEDEKKVARGLLEAAKQMSGDEAAKKHAEQNKESRRWKVGLASVAGAALIGVTGGLAAPLVAAGVGGVMGGLGLGATAAAGYLGTLAGSSVVVGGLFGAYGGRMTGQMMDRYAHEVEDFAFLPVRGQRQHHGWSDPHQASPEERRLRVAIGISGWLTAKEEVVRPWHVLGHEAEAFALRYELDALLGLGNALTSMVTTAAWNYAKKEIIKRTIFASLSAALWPLGLLKVGRIVDNPFSIAKIRSDKAGRVLADALIHRAQGERPVTLIGYSLGARVIYACLLTLAERRAFGLVESAVLMGAPTPSSATDWRLLRAVVAGRLVNVYSANDYILGFLYRTSSIQLGVAGLQRIEGVPDVENVDVSDMVSGHLRYRYLVGTILRQIGLEDVDLDEVAKDEETLRALDERERLEEEEEEERRKHDGGAEGGAGAADGGDAHEEEARRLEEEVQRKNERTFKKPPTTTPTTTTTSSSS